MTRLFKLTYFEESECEVTGKSYSSQEEHTFEIDKLTPGEVLFSVITHVVTFKQKTPTGVIVELDTIYTVDEGKMIRTCTYSLDGNHKWWYEFEVVTQ